MVYGAIRAKICDAKLALLLVNKKLGFQSTLSFTLKGRRHSGNGFMFPRLCII